LGLALEGSEDVEPGFQDLITLIETLDRAVVRLRTDLKPKTCKANQNGNVPTILIRTQINLTRPQSFELAYAPRIGAGFDQATRSSKLQRSEKSSIRPCKV
ncbi:MAG: hypothetical protein J2P36_37130, partial [Ktedonobacteraceae bacterium]|nr:hypothetical protein [Ktedonobacteraceae bacterium]